MREREKDNDVNTYGLLYKNVEQCIMQNVASLYPITVGSIWRLLTDWETNFDQQMNIDAHCYHEKRYQANLIHRYHPMMCKSIDIQWLGHYHHHQLNGCRLKMCDTRFTIYLLANRFK